MTAHRSLFAFALALAGAGCRPDAVPTTVQAPVSGGDELPLPGPAVDRADLPEVDVPAIGADGIVIDGRIDDAGWRAATVTRPFVSPGDGSVVPGSPVPGHARLAWNDQALFVAFEVGDAEATSTFDRDDVDPHIWSAASGIEVMLQPGDPGDNRHYYEVQVDVHEAVWDTRFDDYNAPIVRDGPATTFGHQDWDAGLERSVSRTEVGYVVEMSIPWASLDSDRVAVPPAPGDVWRANFYTFRDGQRHALAWSPLRGEGNFHRAARFGRLRFVAPAPG